MKKLLIFTLAIVAGFAVLAAACGSDSDDDGDSATAAPAPQQVQQPQTTQSSGGTLQQVRDNDTVRCGVRDNLPLFAQVDSDGNRIGFDIDFCRVVAAAVLGDAEKVTFVDLQTSERFTALQSGDVDVLIRNTTWTASRDGDQGANFLFTTYYDGQGIMVPASSGITELAELQDAAICVASGTTTEQNLSDIFDQRNIAFNPMSFEDVTDLRSTYEAGNCDAWTADASQLTGFKNSIEDGGGPEQTILQEIISKEPLGPAVRDGDTEWAQVVRWAVMSTVQAWEIDLTSDNINSVASALVPSENVNLARFLGMNSDGSEFNPGLGLPANFAWQVVAQVGNYEEIYNSNIRGLPLSGSVNDLWTNGGLLYVPPYR